MDRYGLILLEIDCRWPEAELRDSLPLLSPEIQARAARYLSADSRRNLIASRTRLRQALEALDLDQLSVGVAENGRPFHADQKVQFNLSHSHDRAFLAMSRDPELLEGLGVDVEWTGRTIDAVGIGHRFFTPEEYRWIGDDQARFFHVWTRKEAIIKSNGIGLRVELASFNALSDQVEAHVTGRPLEVFTRERPEGYLVSWAVTRTPGRVALFSDLDPDWPARLRQGLF